MRRVWLVAGIGSLALLGCGGSPSDSGALRPTGGDAGQEVDGTLGSSPDGAVGGEGDGAVGPTGDDGSGHAPADGGTAPADGAGTPGDGGGASGEGGSALPDAGGDGPSSNPGDGAVADGAAPDGAAPEASVPHILCGGSDCSGATPSCCVQLDGGASCVQSGAGCAGGVRRTCDSTSDCMNGEVCCFDFSTVPASASCRGDCGGGGGTRLQACRTQAECTSGTCATHSCTVGGPIQSCAAFPPECP